jgi:Holliday junction resolvase RusA-like endonuclease
MTPQFNCFVPGNPQTQGSTRAFMPKNGKFPVITSANPKLKPWRKAMDTAFTYQRKLTGISEPLDGPLRCVLTFVMPRLKSHPTNKEGNTHPFTGLDLDKLIRAAWDALKTAEVIRDDSRICAVNATKRYAGLQENAGVWVSVGEIVPLEQPVVPATATLQAQPANHPSARLKRGKSSRSTTTPNERE